MRRFRVERELGRGGFGRVLFARELGPVVAPPVAIKLAQGMWRPCPDDGRRARDEARLLALLDHPAIVRVQSLIQTQHGPALILEYVPGFTVQQILKQHTRLPVAAALELTAEVADALAAGWTQAGPLAEPLHLLHRDIKPGNLMVTPRGVVKVLDFGIARAALVGRELQSGPVPVGTVDYMAPERTQRRGQPGADQPAGDVFSLGLVLFNALTGAFHGGLPQDAEGWAGLHDDLIGELADALAGEALAGQIADLVLSTVQVDPALRPSPEELRDGAAALARQVAGEGLRAWAARELPQMPAPKPEGLSGYGWAGEELHEVEGDGPVYIEHPEITAPPALRLDLPREPVPGGHRPASRRRRPGPVLDLPVVAAPTWPESPVNAALEPVPMPEPEPVRRRRSPALLVLSLLALALGMHSAERRPDEAAPATQGLAQIEPTVLVMPASFTGDGPVLEASAPAPDALPVASSLGLLHRKVSVALRGDAQAVALVQERDELQLPAQVRPGTWAVRVTFAGRAPFRTGEVTLEPGRSYEIVCSSEIMQCRGNLLP